MPDSTPDNLAETAPTTAGLTVAPMPRVFIHNGQKLPDPDPALPPHRVKALHAATFPKLATATIDGPIAKDGTMEYRYVEAIGVKG
jgi:PRTRC genetic system protein C